MSIKGVSGQYLGAFFWFKTEVSLAAKIAWLDMDNHHHAR